MNLFLKSLFVAFAVFFIGLAPARAEVDERRAFLETLSQRLFGDKSNVYQIPNDRGWRTIAISPFGSSTESLVEAYAGVDQSLAYSAARNSTIDAVVSVNNGVVSYGEESLPSIWNYIINVTRPVGSLQPDRRLEERTMRWLFKPTGARDRNGDRVYSREPSRFLRRYNEFRALFVRLLELEDNGAWRYVAPYRQHSSYSEAADALIHNWETSGYKREIESAQLEFGFKARPFSYRRWSEANEKLKFFSTPFGGGLRIYDTVVLPSPSSWPGLVEWKSIRYRPENYDGEFRFQIAIVDVERPWFDIEYIFDLANIEADGLEALSNLTVGTAPEFGARLDARFPGYIDQIVIVRGIDWINRQSLERLPDRPFETVLGKYAYPQSINVLGFVVRVLPDLSVPTNSPEGVEEAVSSED